MTMSYNLNSKLIKPNLYTHPNHVASTPHLEAFELTRAYDGLIEQGFSLLNLPPSQSEARNETRGCKFFCASTVVNSRINNAAYPLSPFNVV